MAGKTVDAKAEAQAAAAVGEKSPKAPAIGEEKDGKAQAKGGAELAEKPQEKAAKGQPGKAEEKTGTGEKPELVGRIAEEEGKGKAESAGKAAKGGAPTGGGARTGRSGGGGGGAAAAPAAAGGEAAGGGGGEGGGGEVAAAESGGDAAQEQAQEKLEEKLEQHTPEQEGEGEAAGAPEAPAAAAAPPATPEGLAKASEAADVPSPPISGEEAEAGGEGGGDGGGEAEAAPSEPAAESKPALDTTSTPPDPESIERTEAQSEAREAQRDTQRSAESVSDERSQDHAEERADAGEVPAGGGELAGSERDTGLAAIAEPVEGGGGGGGEAAGGGGGGGGGSAQPVPEPEPAPDTASGDPESGLASASSLQPMQAAQALNGVGTSIDNTAKSEGESLQSQIPPVEVGGDGSGGSAVVSAAEGGEAKSAEEKTNGTEQPTPEPEPAPDPGPAPTAAIAVPSVSDTQEGTVRREEAQAVGNSVDSMPTTDPSLDTSAGPPPVLAKTGDADPAQMQDQRAELDATIAQQQAQGATDLAQPAGENQVRDRTPRVALQAPKIATPAAGAAGAAVPDDEAVGIVAEEKQGDEVRAAMAQAQGDMAAKRADHQSKVAEEKGKSDAEIAALKADNAAQQQAEKNKVGAEVGKARADWSAEQNAEVRKANDKAGKEIAKGNEDIAKEETKGNENANKEIAKGEADAQAEKDKAEKDAAEKKREAQRKKEEDSGGIFGWIASKVSAFFSALKDAITKVFDLAKALVKKAIDAAKKLAVAAIEAARKAVVGLIKLVGKALIALGDVLLAAFPGLKKKWRSFIESKVKAAEDAVNRLADALKKGVTKLLDALGKAFEFLLDAYKKAMLAVLDVAKGVAMAAIKAAKAIADLVGTFVVLIKDIARGPMDWLSKLGAAAVDGIKNHLWTAFQRDVKEWFNAKLEEVLGLGMTIWNVLKNGGIKMAEIGTMVFEALKAAIPAALIQLLIEKLVAMIVPAAGAVMAIIEGLQAAWGTVQRILSALGKFVTFLKAVKGGGAGPQFADMLSAAAIVVIDFVANWLLKRLRGPATKVGGKIKAIAQKILAKIKAAAKKVGAAFKKVGAKIKGAFQKAKKKFSDWRAKRKAKKEAKKGKDAKKDAAKKKQDKEEAKRKKRERAYAAIREKANQWLGKGISKLGLRARLALLRIRYRLKSLQLKGTQIVASASPDEVLTEAEEIKLGSALEADLAAAEALYLSQYDAARAREAAGGAAQAGEPPRSAATEELREFQRMQGTGAGLQPGDWMFRRQPMRKPVFSQPHVMRGGAGGDVRVNVSLSEAEQAAGRAALSAGRQPLPPSDVMSRVTTSQMEVGGLGKYNEKFRVQNAISMGPQGMGVSEAGRSLLALEGARSPGVFSTNMVGLAAAQAEVGALPAGQRGAAAEAAGRRVFVNENPMKDVGSATVAREEAQRKAEGRQPFGEGTENRKLVESRQRKILAVFRSLRSRLQGDKSIVGKDSALGKVVEAFHKWFEARKPKSQASAEEIESSAERLRETIVLFLKSFSP